MAVRWGQPRWGTTRFAGDFGGGLLQIAQIESYKAGGTLVAESFRSGRLHRESAGYGALRRESYAAGALRAESFGSTGDNTVEEE